MLRLATLVVVPLLLITGCGKPAPGALEKTEGHGTSTPAPTTPAPTSSAPSPAQSAAPQVIGTIADHLAVPWGIAFLPDRSALVTERDSGRVLQVSGRQVREVGRIEEAQPDGEGGLLGVAVSPSFARDRRVFLYASTGSDNRVLRSTLRNGRLGTLEPILTGIPEAGNHDGGRMIFGPDSMLYVSTGEAGQPEVDAAVVADHPDREGMVLGG